MYQNELLEDGPVGLASVDLPATFYDRPALMFGSLLNKDLDGMTRAMLSPDTLTPSQMKTIRDELLKGKKPSPVMKTILDITTNPLVIIGLVAGLKFPMGSTKVLLDIRNGLIPKSAAMGKMVSGLHGALMKLRTIPEAFETLWGIVRNTERFVTKYGSKANEIFREAAALKPMSKAEGYLISARLDGLHSSHHYVVKALQNEPEWVAFFGKKDIPIAANLQKSMPPRLIRAADKLKNLYKSIWGDLFGNPATRGSMEKAAARKGVRLGKEIGFYHPHQGGYNPYHSKALRGYTGVQYRRHLSSEYTKQLGRESIQRLGGMFPEREAFLTYESHGAAPQGFTTQVLDRILNRWSAEAGSVAGGIWDDILKAGLNETEQRIEFARRMTEYYTKGPGKSVNLVGRLGGKRVIRDTLDAMAGSLQEAGAKGAGALRTELTSIGEVLAKPPTYSMNPWKTAQRYINSTASSYAYHGTGLGEKITKIIRTPGMFRHAPHLESYLVDGLLPHVLGYNTYGQMQRTLLDATRKMKMLDWVKHHPMVEQTLGANHTKALADWLSKSSSLSSASMGGQVANWFHISTLGLNLSATSANAMQTFITTINNVGPRGIWRGLMGYGNESGLVKRASHYMEMITKGIDKRTAFNTAFPEFVAEMGEWSKTTERLLSGDVASAGFTKIFKAKGIWDKIKGAMMLPFSGTEAGNQLLAFYSGRHAHLYQNAAKIGSAALSAEANKVGGSLALLTQFAGGPLGIPSAIMNMNPVWRQYMHFPMRYLAYLHGSLRMGVDPTKLDWGTIGRALAGSTAAYIAARNLAGIDLSRGLMVGALPLPGYEKAAFYPFPFVPPAAGIMGEAAKALLTGETKNLGSVGAMLVPGGIALRRAYRSLSPRYADYKNRTPDNRIPLYDKKGSLLSTMSPMELILRSLGLRPTSVSAEAGAAKWLVSQRDRIRKYRRDYTMALFQNDHTKADKIQREFQKVYPELGPIQIKKSDLRALENRRQMSRLTRIARGFPAPYRPLFNQVIGEASLARMTEDIQIGGLEQYTRASAGLGEIQERVAQPLADLPLAGQTKQTQQIEGTRLW